jgi:hypothetical protein
MRKTVHPIYTSVKFRVRLIKIFKMILEREVRGTRNIEKRWSVQCK